jgi:predicted ATPase/class 3 adenylate cyclase
MKHDRVSSTRPAEPATFVLTDVEGSTRLWERDPESMGLAMARHDRLIASVVAKHGGNVVRSRGEGDSSFSVFEDAPSAVAAAAELQASMAAEPWPGEARLRVRLAIHTGDAQRREDDYYGSTVNRCARLRGLAAGGQSVISAATRALVLGHLPAGVALKDLGSHRLKDLSEPERIYQVSQSGQPSDFPPLRGLEAVPNNLPLQLTNFVGRAAELVELGEVVSRARLVTLTGAGGTGKTRLALEVAGALSDSFADGIWFADLSAITDPALVAAAVSLALGVHDAAEVTGERRRGPADAIVACLGGARVLLIMDNCEQVVSSCAELARVLLAGCPNLRVLATSREVLGLAGEVAWRVRPLPTAEPARAQAPAELLRYDAVRLFVERARDHHREFRLDEATAPSVVQVCARLEGIPLAIELAAARVRILPVQQIAARLDNQFTILARGSASGPARQATLRGAIDWSYDLLADEEKALFSQLSVFAGGWSLEGAEAVCATPGDVSILELLTRLVDKSLVVPDQDHETGRFRLLEPIRAYAAARLADGDELPRARGRHLAWFTGLAQRAARELTGPDQAHGLWILDLEVDNLRAALEWGTAEGDTRSLELAAALRLFWLYRGQLGEGLAWTEAALAAVPAAPPALRAGALIGAGRLAAEVHDFGSARARLEEALAISSGVGLQRELALATRYLAQAAFSGGDHAEAGAMFTRAVAAAREAGDDYLLAVALLDAAQAGLGLGEVPLQMAAEGLAMAEGGGDQRNTAFGLRLMGEIEVSTGDFEAARRHLAGALGLATLVADRAIMIDAQLQLARLELEVGDAAAAARACASALAGARQAGYRGTLPECLETVAELLVESSEPGQGARLLEAASALRRRAGTPAPPNQARRVAQTRRALSQAAASSTLGAPMEEPDMEAVVGEAAVVLDRLSARPLRPS